MPCVQYFYIILWCVFYYFIHNGNFIFDNRNSWNYFNNFTAHPETVGVVYGGNYCIFRSYRSWYRDLDRCIRTGRVIFIIYQILFQNRPGNANNADDALSILPAAWLLVNGNDLIFCYNRSSIDNWSGVLIKGNHFGSNC